MQPNLINVSSNISHPIIIKKWKVRKGMPVSFRQVLLLYENAGSSNTDQQLNKFKSVDVGTVQKICATEGSTIKPGDTLLVLEECSHPTVMRDMCAECGADLRQSDPGVSRASVPMVHSIPELKVSEEQAQNLGKADEIRLLNDRKLVLLVDLDQTLVHTTNDNIPPNIKGVVHFQLYGPQSPWYHTKIRPGTEKFLEAASRLYELHICTFGARNYAHYIAMFLDPDGRFFSHRILSRDECFDANSKTANLRALFPCGDSMVCIIDDREDVWNYAPNLIHVKPYHFFQHTGDIHAPPGLTKTDNDLPDSGFDFSVIEDSEPREGEKKPTKSKATVSGETTTDKDTEDEADNKTSKNSKSDLLNHEIKNEPLPKKLSPISEENFPRNDVDFNQKQEENCEGDVNELTKPETGKVMTELDMDNLATSIKANDLDGGENSLCSGDEKGRTNADKISNQIISPEDTVSQEKEAIAHESQSGDTDGTKKEFTGVNTLVLSENEKEEPVEKAKNEYNKFDEKAEMTKEIGTVQKGEPMEVEKIDEKDNRESESTGELGRSESQEQMEEAGGGEKVVDKRSKQEGTAKTNKDSLDDLIEVEDTDDYLLHLEDILKKIHQEFYKEYDSNKQKGGELPDLKKVIPFVKGQVLEGCELVFSGLVPSHVPLERSRAYLVAKSLGANVRVDLTPTTTHLVAARAGTAKVNASRRQKGVQVVTPDWLWLCAERWERVDERLYPLARGIVTSRHPPAHCSTPQQPQVDAPPQRFSDTINPLLTLSSEEVARMDQEVADLCADSEESDSDEAPMRSPLRNLPKARQTDEEEDSEDSLAGGHSPKGWTEDGPKRKRKFDTTTCTESDLEEDSPSAKFRRGEPLPSDLDLGDVETDTLDDSQDDSQDDAAWTLAGAALEREFLSSDK